MTEKEQQKLRDKAEAQRSKQEKSAAKERALRQKAEGRSTRTRRRLLKRAEKAHIAANQHSVRAQQFDARAKGEINDKEWKRINNSRHRHRMYDLVSAVLQRFQPQNPLRDEGMELQHNGQTLTNQGRIFLGGTKAMNRFTDQAGKDWLCKDAVTCVGTYKPMGALVTEAASKLQEAIDPDTATRAFTYRGKNGRVFGSLQERINVKKDGFDLFKWQTDTSAPIPPHLQNQILREHVTDWLLCNFDTKGENFLEDSQGRLRGIDKEQALSHLSTPGAQHMSYTFSPNPNQTLYNSVFERYAKGGMDALDLQQVDSYIRRVEAISDEQYREMFRGVVEAKHKSKAKQAKMYRNILARKNSLRAEYQRFFGELARERGATELVDEHGKFRFDGPVKDGASLQGPAIAEPQKQGIDRSKFAKPLTLEDSLQAQQLHVTLRSTVQRLNERLDSKLLSSDAREALTAVRDTAKEIQTLNEKRLIGRASPEETQHFHDLVNPEKVRESGAPPAIVRFTEELEQRMASQPREQHKTREPMPAKAKSHTQTKQVKQAPPMTRQPVAPGMRK